MRFGAVGEILGWDLPIGTEIVAGFIDVQANTWAPQIETGGAGSTLLDGLFDVTALVYDPTIQYGNIPIGPAALEDVPVTVNDVALLPGDVAIGPENIFDVAIGTWAPVIGAGNFPVGPEALADVGVSTWNPTIIANIVPATLTLAVDANEGGETTVFTFTANVTPNSWTVDTVEVYDGETLIATLTDQGGNVWQGTALLPPGDHLDLIAVLTNDVAAEAYSAEDVDVTVYATPTIVSHADGAVGVELDETFSWIPSGGSYDIQISTDNSNESAFLANLVVNVSGHGTASYDLPGLDANTGYYIRVRDNASDWSNALGLGFMTVTGSPTAIGPSALVDEAATLYTPTIVVEDVPLAATLVDEGVLSYTPTIVVGGAAAPAHRWAVGENNGGSLVLALDSDFDLALGLIGLKIKTGTLDTSGVALWDMGYNAGANTGAKLEINASKQLALTWGDGSASWTVTGGTTLADSTTYAVHIYRGSGSTTWTIELENAAESQSGDTGSKGYSPTTSGNFVVLGDSPNVSVNNLIVFTGYSSTGDAGFDGENYDAWPASESVEYFASRRGATELVKAGFGESSGTGGATTRVNAGTKGNFTDTQGASNYVASSDIAFVSRWATGDASNDPRLATPGADESGMDFSTDSIACCLLVRPHNLLGSGDRVVWSWGFDESTNQGWELQLTSTNLLRLRVNGVNVNHVALSNDTTYRVVVYHVAGTIYLRVNGSEIGNSGSGVQASTANTDVAALNSVDDASRGTNSHEKHILVMSGGYSGTEATALTEIRADAATWEAFDPADDFYADVAGASFTGGLEIVAAFNEPAVSTKRNVRVDRSNNGRYFEDRYKSYPPGANAWTASTDNDSV